jgi:hypothetical protein
VTGCRHYENGRQVPCPPMCPYQRWPRVAQGRRHRWLTGLAAWIRRVLLLAYGTEGDRVRVIRRQVDA